MAVFVDGCFWHGCPKHSVMPKTNGAFWAEKLRKNVERDRRNELDLVELGWTFVRFWEHELDESLRDCAAAVLSRLGLK